jgi:anti-sigma B factor antagonist
MSYLAVERVQDIAIITPNNKRIDAAFSNQFRHDILELKAQGYSKIILDLVNVEFIDSSGLGVIVFIAKKIDKDEKLVICRVNSSVLHTFKLTKMDLALNLTNTVKEAIVILKNHH